MPKKIVNYVKEYFTVIFTIFNCIVLAAITYGSTTAVANVTLQQHENRLVSIEQVSRQIGEDNAKTKADLANIKEKVNDIWYMLRDNNKNKD